MAWEGNILALDLATRAGWAYGAPGDVPRSGSHRFAREGATRARVLRSAREWLSAFVAVSPVRMIVFEAPIAPGQMQGKTNVDTIRTLIGLAEHVDELMFDRADVREASVTVVRRFFLGSNPKGPEAKRLTKLRCRDLGWRPEDDNAADALALWAYMVSIVSPEHGLRFAPLFGRSA